ncbi:hypothetical protein BIV25_03035 [Streptomyces sp. MUSC 14]|uniref:hypothetical protein n=1 Tax=Streptomyces sp. MUSC 14 TaxID=1354889 RepID=UPI0008F5DEBD|nr:hypothetical protein [Streptomyces sp. MUSC 14]OIK02570.1 hypothetical protein BIV25_03035 [Streptomyces sp. MUSC 14]
MVGLGLPCVRLDHRELDWVQTRMVPNFKTRLMLVVIAALFSLVVALTTAFLLYAVKGSFLSALTVGGGTFIATMTLLLGALSLLLS